MRIVLLITALTLAQAQTGNSQAAPFTCWIRGPADKLGERPSPLDSISVQLGGGAIKLCYGRPSARGRKVNGRAGPVRPAVAARRQRKPLPSTCRFAATARRVRVGKRGSTHCNAIPGASKWQIVVNRGVQRWGVPIDSDVRARDVGAGTVATESLGAPVETLTLKFAPAAGNATELVLEWEKTRVRIPIRRAS